MYKTITETVPEFFFVYNLLQGKITFVSPQFYELAVGMIDAAHPNELRAYIHPGDQESFDQFFDDLSQENNYTNRLELRTHEDLGGVKWVELHTFPVEDNKPQVELVVGHIIDITDKKERIEALEQEHEKLDSILKILAHDLRGPFGQVHMIGDVLKSLMNESEQKRYGMYLGMLQSIGNRSIALLDNLLSLVSLQEGTLNLQLKKHDLRKIFNAVAESFKMNMLEKQINCSLEQPDFAVVAEVDHILLEQALSNLLSNAVKFTPDGGGISLRLQQKNQIIRLEVEDSGIGIPEKHISDLFREFSKIRRKGLKGEKPTGLGLAICKQIIHLHKGKVSVQSHEQKGTTFTIELPLS